MVFAIFYYFKRSFAQNVDFNYFNLRMSYNDCILDDVNKFLSK